MSSRYRDKLVCLEVSFLITLLAFFLLDCLVVKAVVVNGNSMYPTLHNNDFLFIKEFMFNPVAGDIVLIRTKDRNIGENYILKRIIAIEGQTVVIDYQGNGIYIDGICIDEPYINYEDSDPMSIPEDYPDSHFVVPEGCFFVLGDNRNVSLDSRSKIIGMVECKDVRGKVWTKIRIPILNLIKESTYTRFTSA